MVKDTRAGRCKGKREQGQEGIRVRGCKGGSAQRLEDYL